MERGKRNLIGELLGKVIDEAEYNRGNFKNSCREIAKRRGFSRPTASRAVKKAGFRIVKKLIDRNFPDRSIAKRAQCCAEFQLLSTRLQSTLPQETFFFSGEFFFRTEPDSINKQNDRAYVRKEDTQGEAGNLLVVKKNQRAKGAGRVRGRRQRFLYR